MIDHHTVIFDLSGAPLHVAVDVRASVVGLPLDDMSRLRGTRFYKVPHPFQECNYIYRVSIQNVTQEMEFQAERAALASSAC